MIDTFGDRMKQLREMTGSRQGSITGQVVVDQVYAHFQHERVELHHPRGGEAFYLTKPLMERHPMYLRRYAETVLDDGGRGAMRDAVEDLAGLGGVASRAPVDFSDLRRSGHPTVTIGEDEIVYDRPPVQHRLEKWELQAKARLRKLPPELIGYIWWKVMHHTEPPPHQGGRRFF